MSDTKVYQIAACCVLAAVLAAVPVCGQTNPAEKAGSAPQTYVLGTGDQITLLALDAEEFSGKKIPIDAAGDISLPLVGRIKAAGLTASQLEAELNKQLKVYIQDPRVSVIISEFRSQPVSVIGAVKSPGVHQLEGQKTLVEVLSLAGGLRDDAGSSVKITRKKEEGSIPVLNSSATPDGKYYVGQVSTRGLLSAANPEQNILVCPHDVISVPREDLVYVVGEVNRAGGFVLNDKDGISVLQALSLAGGTKPEAQRTARLLRSVPNSSQRVELSVDLKTVLTGKGEDLFLKPDDVLYIPSSTGKKVAIRTTEMILQTLSGVVVWRGGRF